MSGAERARRHRDKQRGGPPREPKPCGSRAAIARHQRNPDKWGALKDCPTCSVKESERQQGLRERR